MTTICAIHVTLSTLKCQVALYVSAGAVAWVPAECDATFTCRCCLRNPAEQAINSHSSSFHV